jgi:DNA-binding MarR family transcriptional regulator
MSKQISSRSVWTLDQSLVHQLHRAVQAADLVFGACVGESEITPRQFAVMAAVARDPNASQTKLVGATGIDRSTLADLVKRLLKKGLLQRKRTREDARAYAVRLTPKSEALFEQLREKAALADELLLAHLSQRDRSALLETLDGLAKAAQQTAGGQQNRGPARMNKRGRSVALAETAS